MEVTQDFLCHASHVIAQHLHSVLVEALRALEVVSVSNVRELLGQALSVQVLLFLLCHMVVEPVGHNDILEASVLTAFEP